MVSVRRWALLLGSLLLAGMCGGVAGSATRPVGALAQMPKRTVCDAESKIKGCARVRAFNSPQALAVSPDGRFLYVAVSPGASVVTFSRNLKTGALRQLRGSFGCVSELEENCIRAESLQGAKSLAVSRDGRHVYVAAAEGDAVSVLVRQPGLHGLRPAVGERQCVRADRRITEGCSHGRVLGGPNAVAVSGDGRNVYVTGTWGLAAFSRDARTGALAQLSGTGGCVTDDGTDPYRLELEGDFNDDAFEIVCSQGRAIVGLSDVKVSPDGANVYATSGVLGAVVVFARDRTTGTLTQLEGPLGCLSGDDSVADSCTKARALGGAESLAISADGRTVYVASPYSNALVVLVRDRRTGALTQPEGAAGCLSEDGNDENADATGVCTDGTALAAAGMVALGPDGVSAYVVATDAVSAFARNTATGALRQLGGTYRCISATGTGGACARASSLLFAAALAISPNGRHAYLASGGTDNPLDTRPSSHSVTIFQRTPRPKPQ
jgi:DNA-binding beta-propeller fold protein YncE